MMAKKVTSSDQLFKGRHFEREIVIRALPGEAGARG
jgi:hypothetical protein